MLLLPRVGHSDARGLAGEPRAHGRAGDRRWLARDARLVEGRRYPCAHINQADVRTQLAALDFDPASIDLELTPGTTPEIDDVRELFMVFAQKR